MRQRRLKMKPGWLALFLILISTALFAKEPPQSKTIKLPPDNATAQLKDGPGAKTAQAYCGMCHSTDYIVRQPVKDAKTWTAEVKKMVTVYGAPISPADRAAIAAYLAKAYGAKPSPEGNAH
jgi:mono/diheme cytochrome c family protein